MHSQKTFAKFLVVGGLCTLANFLVIWGMTEQVGLHYLLSFGLAFLTVNAGGYVLNKYYTFGRTETPLWTELVRYYRVMFTSMLFSLLATFLLVDVLGMHYLVAALVLTLVLTMRNFVAHRGWTFK